LRQILLLLLWSNFLYSQSRISETEKTTLLTIYQQTDGENWAIPWDLTKDPKSWYGVHISGEGHVLELRLNANLLKGQLPSISNLSQLQVLDLNSNKLQGSLPDLNALNQLQVLDVSTNNFSGNISSSLQGLPNLKELYLGGNTFQIDNTDAFLKSLPYLTHLDLSDFNLKTIPLQIKELKNLRELYLRNDSLSSGYNILAPLNLEKLDISKNQLKSIPKDLAALSQLKHLNLSENSIENGGTSQLSFLKNLEWLSLGSNSFTNIPNEIQALTNLIHLDLSRNEISTGISTLSTLKNLQQLWLNQNKITGNFPSELTSIPCF